MLSAGAWVRGLSRFPIQLPHEIEEYIGDIEEFYKSRHSGRKLHFHPLLSHGTLTFQSKLGKYELEVSAMQLSILSCWNRRPNQALRIDELVLGIIIIIIINIIIIIIIVIIIIIIFIIIAVQSKMK